MRTEAARRRFVRNRGAVVGTLLVLSLVFFAIVGPWLSHHDPYASAFTNGVTSAGTPTGPSLDHWLGTDRIFRDEFVRLAYGARISLLIAFLSTLIASVIGASVGIIAGYYEGSRGIAIPFLALGGIVSLIASVIAGNPRIGFFLLVVLTLLGYFSYLVNDPKFSHIRKLLTAGVRLNVDTALMRFTDVGLSFPFLLLVMALGAALDKTNLFAILLTLGLTGWLGTARVLRAKTLQVRGLDFIVASRALGQSTWRILFRHILPNVAGPLIVIATVSVAQMIIAESVLSYLGVGISPPTPTWGYMLFEGQDIYLTAPWLLASPALAILAAVFGFNLMGEGLRDALDPKDA